ncbi:hypothetical protein F5Y17DRAFT_272656 [Xylariaceae sp. FL0594]|nr:hypothetical protein F5Y17DRAFT_272656 [Xylariaceae sp. FL0594]
MAANSLTPDVLLSLEKTASESRLHSLLAEASSEDVLNLFVQYVAQQGQGTVEVPSKAAITLGLASLAVFLQANVTGPVLDNSQQLDSIFLEAFRTAKAADKKASIESFRSLCQRSLDTDGVSPYPYIPHIELFCLARFIFVTGNVLPTVESDPEAKNLSWIRLRIHLWHYKLLTQPSLGPGSLYTKSGRFSDVSTLEELINKSLGDAEAAVFGLNGGTPWPQESQMVYRLEEANCHIMLGNEVKAKKALQDATRLSGLIYALSGALGKRTRYQEKSYSQLVVLAKSLQLSSGSEDGKGEAEKVAPEALPLNDDTLLEKIQFNTNNETASSESTTIPAELRELKPDSQPELRPVDQIILLTEATLKDTFSPSDSLTLEEVLPYAVRVIDDKAVNWQIYTQALLVRSRIELNRSRTVERGVLQMQAVADQVIVDTQAPPAESSKADSDGGSTIPAIHITKDGEAIHPEEDANKPRSFFPAPKPSESATAQERLQFVNALASPPRWHLESELAYAWTSIGSLVSALEIFKRLRLWPEVALCLATAASSDDADGRGAGGEEKARAIVRWRLFERSSGTPSSSDADDDEDHIDIDSIKPGDYYGAERSPPPPNAPRLWCILGDMENDARHYERAWETSGRRFARAQRSLGELYLKSKDWDKAREAYRLAVAVNRLSPELWSRLGDIELRLGNFPDAAEAFQRSIGSANDKAGGDDARTWSNLGSSLLSWYREVMAEAKLRKDKTNDAEEAEEEEKFDMEKEMPSTRRAAELGRTASQLLRDALLAFKRGATIADTNWKIWDNVITIAASLTPNPALEDVVLGVRNIIRIRRTEDALDVDILALLVRECTKNPASGNGIFTPARGSLESKIIQLFEEEVTPLITTRSAVWDLVARLRAWRRDYVGALDASEKAWRTALSTSSVSPSSTSTNSASLSLPSSERESKVGKGNWLTDPEEWDVVVQRTLELVAAYENYGPRSGAGGDEQSERKWKGKARSAVRSVLSKARESAWEGDARWESLKACLEDLR